MPETRDRRPVVLIPAYKPEAVLTALVEALHQAVGIQAVVVVDDGGGTPYGPIFDLLRMMAGVHVLRHFVNLGKGAALKTGLNYAACTFPDSVGVVTADADGQHAVEDILRVAAAMSQTPGDLILGARAFDTNVPLRSRFGNSLTQRVMQAVTGQKITDTQTGLRGIPMRFIGTLLRLRPTGYDFELEMLVTCRSAGQPVREIPIRTIYIENNRSSHFNPLRDSMRIYFVFVRFLGVSLSSSAIDNVVFIGVHTLTPNVVACLIAARAVAGTWGYFMNKRAVFHSHVSNRNAAPKYWLTVVVYAAVSYMIIRSITSVTPIPVVPAKLMTESVLFFASFVLQRDYIFAPKASSPE